MTPIIEELSYLNRRFLILKSFCKYEVWQKHITGLEEFVISYVLDRDAFNSLIRSMGKRNFVLLIGRLESPSVVLNK